jgi:hypothetical protein
LGLEQPLGPVKVQRAESGLQQAPPGQGLGVQVDAMPWKTPPEHWAEPVVVHAAEELLQQAPVQTTVVLQI